MCPIDIGIMNNLALFLDWYFIELPKKISRIWLNFLWFINNYFSLIDLLKTFFFPWKGYYYSYREGGFDPARWMGNLIFNTFSRFIGMILRLLVIILGIIAEIFIVILGILFFFSWAIFPVLLILSFLKGFKII